MVSKPEKAARQRGKKHDGQLARLMAVSKFRVAQWTVVSVTKRANGISIKLAIGRPIRVHYEPT